MRRIILPNTELSVSQFAYGTASYDASFSTEDGLKLVAKYMEAGGNFLDTAHCYCSWVEGSDGSSERFVGAAVRTFGRDGLVIATKGGHTAMPLYPRPDDFMSPEMIRRDFSESLDRLGLPSVDLYYLHRDDPRVPAGEIIEAANEHVVSGQTRYLGASNWSVARYLEANHHAAAKGIQPFAILQNQWSLAQPDWSDLAAPGALRYVQDDELPLLRERNIATAAYSPTANGYFATNGERGRQFESEQARRQLAAVNVLAERHAVSPNQVALAYLLNQPFPAIPVLGTRDEAHLLDALGAASLELTSEELTFLRA